MIAREVTMKPLKVDHIGIALRSVEPALSILSEKLGMKTEGSEEVSSQKVRTTFLDAGGTHLELLESLSADSAVAKFIEKRGEGIHHVAVAVDNIETALEEARRSGIELIDAKPRRGARGKLIAFLHPKSTAGILIELVQTAP